MKPKSIRYKKDRDKVWVLLDNGNVILKDNTNIIDKELYYENMINELNGRIRHVKRSLSNIDNKIVSNFLIMMAIIYGSAITYNISNISFLYFLLGLLVSSVYGHKIYKNVNTKKILEEINKELKIELDIQKESFENLKKEKTVNVISNDQEVYKVNNDEITRVVSESYYNARNICRNNKHKVLTRKKVR